MDNDLAFALLFIPVSFIAVGAWAYWIATLPEKPAPRHPAE